MRYSARIIAIVMALALVTFAQVATLGNALACGAHSGSSQDQVLSGVGVGGASCDEGGVTSAISAAVSILSYIVGVAAVIMVIVAALKYITSAGDSGKASSAKNTLVYALIGLAIAALAQFLIHFVLNTTQGAQPCPSDPSITVSDKKCK